MPLCLRSPIQALQRACFPNAVHAAHKSDCSEAPGRCNASLTWTCHSGSNAFKGGGEGRPLDPKDPLAQGVRNGILNLALWGPGDKTRREGRAAAHLRSFRLLALIAGHYGPRPGLGVRGPGALSGAPAAAGCRRAELGSTCTKRRRLEPYRSQPAAVKPRPPRRPRPPQPRGLPGLVVPNLASAGSTPEIRMLGTAWVEAGGGGWGAGLVEWGGGKGRGRSL